MEADITSQAVGLASSADFSILNLFLRADIIVKSVIIILIVSSIYSWAVIIEKYRLFKKINKSSEEFENKFWKSNTKDQMYQVVSLNLCLSSKSVDFIDVLVLFYIIYSKNVVFMRFFSA